MRTRAVGSLALVCSLSGTAPSAQAIPRSPRGSGARALGDVLQIRNAKLSPYNQNTAALPQAYGALAKLYTQLKYGVNKKIEPLTSDSLNWGIEANGFYGNPSDAISTPEHYYFTLPTFVQQGYGPELEKAADVAESCRL